MISVPYIFTTLYAFKLLLTYENEREVDINKLSEYRQTILERVSEEFQLNEEEFDIDSINENVELFSLIETYPMIFTLDNNNLCLNPNITLEQLNKAIDAIDIKYKTVFTAVYEINHTKDILNMLGIYKIFEFKEKVENYAYQLEQEIEEQYMNNFNPIKIKQLLYARLILLANIGANNKAYIENYFSFVDEDEDYVMDEYFDYFEESRYIKNGEEYPIDNELYKDSEFYEDIIENDNPVQQNIEDIYHYAIFGAGPLYKDKYQYDINQLYVRSSYSDLSKCSFSEIDDEEFAFYLVYLKKLDILIENGASELILPRKRLTYLLDGAKHNLYNQENINKLYNTVLNMNITSDSFDGFEKDSRYYIKDLFEGNSNKKLEKAAFISTYYELTKSKIIEDDLKKYSSHPQYSLICKLICGIEPSKRNK